jgi:uncharacterized oligopeptide transporter (OPT) family protein
MTSRIRAAAAAGAVAAIIGLVFPYLTLRLGFGPNTSIVSTLLGFVLLHLVRVRGTAALHLSHVAGVAAGQTAFMGVALMAFDLLRAREGAAFALQPSPQIVFAWLACAGVLGALLAWPLRKHYIERERLPFAAGAAAAETILALEGGAQRPHAAALLASLAGSMGFTWLRPASWAIGPLGLGSGMLVGLRVSASMAAGWLVARALPAGLVAWIAAAAMVAGGVAAAALRIPSLLCALRVGFARSRWSALRRQWPLVAGAVAAVVGLCTLQRYALGMPVLLTLACIAMSGPLLLVGTRVLGETNWAPVLSLAVVAQAAIAAMVPGCLVASMVGSTLAGAIPNGGQHMMQSLRAASIVGAPPRDTALAQIGGVVVGAFALSVSYPLLAAGASSGHPALSSPLSEVWATWAQALALGPAAMPRAIRMGLAAGASAGVLLALAERHSPSLAPSPTAIGIGMLLPGGLVASVFAGGLAARIATQRVPGLARTHASPVAAGLVAGDALAACVVGLVAATRGRG